MLRSRLVGALLGAAVATILGSTVISGQMNGGVTPAGADLTFKMVRSTSVVNAKCLTKASATVSVTRLGRTEQMVVHVSGLFPSSVFTVFLIQVPNTPFGISMYEGDVGTDATGVGSTTFVGRFSQSAFAVGPGTAPAPTIHAGAFPDAATNPAFSPVHLLHLGIWFKTPQRSASAGCSSIVTPFNGTHFAGIQVLNTGNFPVTSGPLGALP